MSRYRFALGNAYNGPVEVVVEITASRPGEAVSKLADILARSWGGVELRLPGLEHGDKVRLLVNPAYFPAPERVDDQPTLTEER